MDNFDPVTAYKAGNSREGHLILQLLEQAGIQGRVASNGVEFIAGELPYQVASCPILVHRADLERAHEVIERYEETLCGDREPWVPEDERYCYHCGEPVESAGTVCPACKLPLDWPAAPEAEEDEVEARFHYRHWIRAFVLLVALLLFLTRTPWAVIVIAVVVVEMIMAYDAARSKKLSNS
ncbi:MAG: DUF2007 domain-containing protein [Pirellulales bacterium]|nr:DUF2007 domain-containing protein [Pirellulales bacterium]